MVANGDVTSAADAALVLEQSGADAVMVGRASYGAPWAAAEIAHAAGSGAAQGIPRSAGDIAGYVIAHYEAMLSLYGVESGLRQARKHLGWYLERHAAAAAPDLRKAIMTGLEPRQVIAALRKAFLAGEAAMDIRDVA